jgi:hypothetical protein
MWKQHRTDIVISISVSISVVSDVQLKSHRSPSRVPKLEDVPLSHWQQRRQGRGNRGTPRAHDIITLCGYTTLHLIRSIIIHHTYTILYQAKVSR